MTADGLARGLGSLQRERHQAVVIKLTLAVNQLAPASRGRLAERKLVLVHQADHRVRAARPVAPGRESDRSPSPERQPSTPPDARRRELAAAAA